MRLAESFRNVKEFLRATHARRQYFVHFVAGTSSEHLDVACLHIKLGRILLREGKLSEAEPESRLGFDLLRAHDTSEDSYLKGARKDLAAMYTAERKDALLAELNQH